MVNGQAICYYTNPLSFAQVLVIYGTTIQNTGCDNYTVLQSGKLAPKTADRECNV